MKPFKFASDSQVGVVQAQSLQIAFDQLRPTDAQIADGAWLWVEDPVTGERLDTRDAK